MDVAPYVDRTKETTTTTGTGTVTLLGAATGYTAFSTYIQTGQATYYCITDNTASNPSGTDWEVGWGVYTSAGPTLSRLIVLASSNADALVNFPAGTKDVYVVQPAQTIADRGMTLAMAGHVVPQ